MTMITFVPSVAIVAAVQFCPQLGSVQENLVVAQQLCFEAAAKGARLVVLPELCTGGYVFSGPREAADAAQHKDGYQTEAFVPIARRFGCHVVFGYVEVSEGKLYNSAAMVGPGGLVGNFQKRNLHSSDNVWAEPSEQQSFTVITECGRTGVLICRDVMNKYRESYRFAKPGQKFYNKGDVDTIALLTNWGSAYGYPADAWVELVEETGANCVVSNRVGKERDQHFKGGACVIDRQRRIYTYGSSFTDAAIVGGVTLL